MAGQRDQLVLAWPAAAGLCGGQDGQERVGEQGQDGPPVPGGPAADLVLVQGGQFLSGGEPVLDFPPRPGYPHQPGQRHRAGGMGAVEGVLAVADPAADQQPVRPLAFGRDGVGDLDQGPVIPAGALGAGPGRDPLPGAGGQPLRQFGRRSAADPGDRQWCLAIART